MTAIIVVASILAYLFIGGAVGYGFYATRKRRCKDCRRGGSGWCFSDHGTPAGLFGAFWPATIPMFTGALASHWLTGREDRAARKAKRQEEQHQRRMAELKAQESLAEKQRVATMESVRFLVENGIQADVPGLYEVVGDGQ